jgi:hypothetical protein
LNREERQPPEAKQIPIKTRITGSILSLVDVASWPNVVNINDFLLTIVPKDHTQIAHTDTPVSDPLTGHMQHAGKILWFLHYLGNGFP